MSFPVVISLVAICLSVISLTWQILSWRLGGSRIKASTNSFITVGTAPDLHLLGLTATNRGRAATEVHYMALELPGNRSLAPMPNPVHDIKMPRKLEPGGQTTISYPHQVVLQGLAEQGVKKVRPVIRTGHGDVRGKWIKPQ